MTSFRRLQPSSVKGHTASTPWCVLRQEATNQRDYAGFASLPTSNPIAKLEVGI
jgi:hypothetical protein